MDILIGIEGKSCLRGRLNTSSGVASVESLYVEMEDRRQGAGAHLYQQFEQLAESHGCQTICLEVHLQNHHARCFWRQQGFEDCGVVGDPEYSEWVKHVGFEAACDLDASFQRIVPSVGR